MKPIVAISLSAALLISLSIPALAMECNPGANIPTQHQKLIARLQDASDQARVAAQENKNHPPFAGKSYEIDSLIQRIQSGERVSIAEIDQALTPIAIH
ncbi:MAG: hypothetical protein ACLQDV_14655 [Candidatus Binataceae bacterium]